MKIRTYSALIAASALVFSFFINEARGQQFRATTQTKKSANLAVSVILDGQPDTFTATQVIEQGSQHIPGVVISRKGDLYRVESEQIGVKFAVIGRPDIKKVYTIRPDKKLYVEVQGNDPLAMRLDPFDLEQIRKLRNVKVEDLGTENIDGHPCKKYLVSFDQANQVQKITVWKATDLNNLIIRQEQEFLNMRSSIKLQNVKLEVAPDQFELPKDYKQVKTTGELFKKEGTEPSQPVNQ
jgi:hypothetical protein